MTLDHLRLKYPTDFEKAVHMTRKEMDWENARS